MKKFLLLLAVALLGAATSCDSLTKAVSGTKMDTPEATTQVVECLKNNIDFAKWKIYGLRWMEGESLENDIRIVSVDMINDTNSCFTQTFLLSGPGAGPGELRKATGIGLDAITFDSVKGITPEMIDPAAIQKQYEQAKAMIPGEYTFESISDYTFTESRPSGNAFLDRGKEFGKISSEFSINVTEKGKEVVESAGKKSIQYYDIDFNVLPDGSVEIDE